MSLILKENATNRAELDTIARRILSNLILFLSSFTAVKDWAAVQSVAKQFSCAALLQAK